MIDTYRKIAHEIWLSRHPSASCLILAGSLVRGEGTAYSDLDIVVLYERLPNAYRESFIVDGIMVETFIHDLETAMYFMEQFDRPDGTPALAQMIREGLEIPEPCALSARLKEMAAAQIEKGPIPCSDQAIINMRYMITNLVDDIRAPRSREELTGSLTALYTSVSEFYFKAHGLWGGSDKNIPRMLKKNHPELAEEFCRVFARGFGAGETEGVITLTEKILTPFGGFCFDGYRREAGPEQRMQANDQASEGVDNH